MKNIKLFLITLVVMSLTFGAVFAGPFRADAKTKRIPAGATFQLEFLQPVSTYSGGTGDSFVATLKKRADRKKLAQNDFSNTEQLSIDLESIAEQEHLTESKK